MTKRTRAAVVGLGRIGWSCHLEELHKREQFEVVAVADPDCSRTARAAALTGCSEFPSLKALLDGTEVDLVIIATPSTYHASEAKLVLERNCHCILEKPMATSYEDSREIVEAARAADLHLFVHHQCPFDGEFRLLKSVIDSGILGDLFELRGVRSNYERRWDWQTLKKNGGGQLNNAFPHLLSVALPLLGEPITEVFADLRNVKNFGDAEDHAHVQLVTASGRVADLTATSASVAPSPRWTLLGKNGSLWNNWQEAQLKYYDPALATPRTVIDGACPEGMTFNEDLPWQEETRCLQHEGQPDFYDNVVGVLAGREQMVVTPESALEVMRVINLCRQSAETGKSACD